MIRSQASATTAALAVLAAVVALAAAVGSAGPALLLLAASLALLAFSIWRDPSPDRAARAAQMRSTQPAGTEPSQGGDEIWHTLIGALAAPVVVLDGAERVLRFNHPSAELFPAIRDGLPLHQLSRSPELGATVRDVMGSRAPRSFEMMERVPIERRLQVVVTAVGPSPPRPGLPAVLIQLRDMSEHDRLAQMRTDFVANASHELRTPLASLKGFIETLQGPARDDPAARERFLEIMDAQATRMTRLLDDLLSLSRIEMRAHLPLRGTVDMAATAREAIDLLSETAAKARANVVLEAEPGRMLVRGDADELLQVLQNLIQNAIKYGRTGGTVRVAVARDTGRPGELRERIVTSVSDDGPGISEEHLPRLTERFYRVDTATSRQKGGTGLGLAIVKHIVARHGGQLRIESKLGEGSRFSVALDALRAEAPS